MSPAPATVRPAAPPTEDERGPILSQLIHDGLTTAAYRAIFNHMGCEEYVTIAHACYLRMEDLTAAERAAKDPGR